MANEKENRWLKIKKACIFKYSGFFYGCLLESVLSVVVQ